MGATAPRGTAQLVAFQPAQGKRVISTMTAAQMKRMMEGVVLGGTGKRAILNGYSSAGKTGTAQKIDPATGTYSRWRHIASFAGFAPVNNPAISVLVILDSPVGLHEGGQVAAPVFNRVTQQVLAYLNVPHDLEVQDPRRFLLLARAKDEDVAEGSPDHITTEAEAANTSVPPPQVAPQQSQAETRMVAAAYKPPQATLVAQPVVPVPAPSPPRAGETIVLDVGGGVVVPDFSGKPLRTALEEAQAAGIELEITGSGVARTQLPAAGSRIPPGGHVSVRFGR